MPSHLFRYSPAPVRVVHPRSLEGSIPFTIDGLPLDARDGVFLAAGPWRAPVESANLFALTYEPRHVARVPGPWDPHDGCWDRRLGPWSFPHWPVPFPNDFQDLFGRDASFNRSWPAFGRPGGGLETLLTAGALSPCGRRHWDGVAGKDEQMLATQADLAALAQGLRGMLQASAKDNPLPDAPRPLGRGNRESDRGTRRAVQTKQGGVAAGLESDGAGMVVSFTQERSAPHDYHVYGAWWTDALPFRIVQQVGDRRVKPASLHFPGGAGCIDPAHVQQQAEQMRKDVRRAMFGQPFVDVWSLPGPWRPEDFP